MQQLFQRIKNFLCIKKAKRKMRLAFRVSCFKILYFGYDKFHVRIGVAAAWMEIAEFFVRQPSFIRARY